MIYRFLYVGYTNNIHSVKLCQDIRYYVSLSHNRSYVFMYIEANEKNIDVEYLVEGEFICYPNGNKWERANEIFHYSFPVGAEQWSRKYSRKTPHIMVNWLKPEKIASYIYYHYQYQEELPGNGDRYGVIYLHGQQLIFYLEEPTEEETKKLEGKLKTKNTPIEHWDELMEKHFTDTWREIENLEVSEYISFGNV